MSEPKIKSCYNKGYSLLLTVVVVGSIVVAITISLIISGLDYSRSSFVLEQSKQARALAHACAEIALQEIRNSVSFTGSATINFPLGDCDYIVIDQGGENRLINASATIGSIIKKIEINISQINPQINIASWQEVKNF